MNTFKRTICLALTISLLLSLCMGISANAANEEPKYYDQASALYELGLFKGTGTNADGSPIFDLMAPANRIQGLVMLIRLLGEEQDALAYTGACPFTDVPAWAKQYAAYAYAKGYTKGTTATTFGADDGLLGKAYLTFVLRALGYSDANGDFSYNEATTFATGLGLIAEGQCEGNLLRDDCAMVSYSALRQKMKGTDTTLAEKLVADGVLTIDAVQNSGVMNSKIAIPWDNENGRLNAADIAAAIPDAYYISAGGSRGNWTYESVPWDTPEVQLLLLATNSGLSDYVQGKTNKLPASKREGFFNLSKSYYSIITVINDDYQLIAYGVLPLKYNAEMIYLTTCQIGGKEVLDSLKKNLNSLTKEVKTINAELFYKEFVTTIHPDGVEDTKAYLRIDQSKLPSALSNAVYYKKGGDMDKESLISNMLSLNNYAPDTDEYARFNVIGKEHELDLKAHYGEDWNMFFYDENKILIANVEQKANINATAIATVVNLQENAAGTIKTDEEVQEVLNNFVANYKNTSSFKSLSTFATEHVDKNLEMIQKTPQTNPFLKTTIEAYKDGSYSENLLMRVLESWLRIGGSYGNQIITIQ